MVDEPKKPIRRTPERRSASNTSTFRFQRNQRQLIGFFLVLAVGGIIYYVATKPREPKSAGAWRPSPAEGTDNYSDEPIEFGRRPELSADSTSLEPEGSTTTSEPDSSTASPRSPSSANGNALNSLLETGSAEELVQELLRLRDLPLSSSHKINSAVLRQRSKVAKRILEMNISDSQETFATNELIENALQLDSVNKLGKLGDFLARDELIKIRDKYYDHEIDAFGAKASLGFPLIPLHDYFESDDTSDLVAVADQFDLHADKIMRHPPTTRGFVELLLGLLEESGYAKHYRSLSIRIIARLEKSQDPKIDYIALALREQVYFSEVDLASLVDRIEGGNEMARSQVQSFFEALDENPTSRVSIYEIAIDVVEEYERLGRADDATALINWLVSINGKNKSEDRKKKVAELCNEFLATRKAKQN